jgi:hypothetical protein
MSITNYKFTYFNYNGSTLQLGTKSRGSSNTLMWLGIYAGQH